MADFAAGLKMEIESKERNRQQKDRALTTTYLLVIWHWFDQKYASDICKLKLRSLWT